MKSVGKGYKINVIPIGKSAAMQGYQLLLERWAYLCGCKKWNGIRQNLRLRYSPETISVGGGKYGLEKRQMLITSENVGSKFKDKSELLLEWLNQFDKVILICDAEELFTSHSIRHEITSYRINMRRIGRYFDCLLLLTDVDNVMDIDYTGNYQSTYIGICTAFSPKGYNKSQLKPKFDDIWRNISSYYLGQIYREVRTKVRQHYFTVPLNLLCTSEIYNEAGYTEALILCMEGLFQDYNLHINKKSNFKLYNDMINLRNIWNNVPSEQIRLAVIGQTSSGKTYLLTDLCQSLARMGYREENDLNTCFRFVGDFQNDVTDPETGVNGTPIYICRQNNHYHTYYRSDSAEDFSLEFIDIPGEVITSDSIKVFIEIIKALHKCEEKYFKIEKWETESGKKSSFVVKYAPNSDDETLESHYNVETDNEEEKGDVLPDIDDEKKQKRTDLLLNEGTGLRDKAYLTTETVVNDLKLKRYKIESVDYMTGQQILKDFYDYIPDTFVNAIADAWDVLDIANNYKENFVRNYKDQFYFLYYCLSATDIVICDKVAVPLQGNMTKAPKDTFEQMMAALGTFNSMFDALEIEKKTEKHWYFVAKGVDSLMKQKNFQIFSKHASPYDEDATYSLYTILQALSLQEQTNKSCGNDNDDTENVFQSVVKTDTEIPPFIEDYDIFKEMISGKWEHIDAFLHICHDKAKNPPFKDFLKEPNEYHISTGQSLNDYLTNRISLFISEIVGPCHDTEIFPFLGNIPPHVFFSATPIDCDFNIYGHDTDNARKFENEVASPSNRICFGALQLMKDILLQNDLKLPSKSNNYGRLLSYFFGGR
jgi:GTPase SAR1 family protein